MKQISLRKAFVALPFLALPISVQAQAQGGAISPKGCYSSSTGLTSLGSYTWQTPGYCQKQCVAQGKAVGATTKGSDCLCGDKLPPTDSQASDSSCNIKCQGYGNDVCGGSGAFSVFLTGLNANPGSISGSSSSNKNSNSNGDAQADTGSDPDSNSSSSSSSSQPPQQQQQQQQKATTSSSKTKQTPPSVVTKQSTIVVTAAGGQTHPQTKVITTTETPQSKSGGSNTAGIAAGVVVGVVALAAIAGGLFFFIKHRKRKAMEEEFRQNASMSSYNNLKPSPSSAGSASDSRLEPSVMMQRRQSDGSIADNQDYSRRILKVTNPDHS